MTQKKRIDNPKMLIHMFYLFINPNNVPHGQNGKSKEDRAASDSKLRTQFLLQNQQNS